MHLNYSSQFPIALPRQLWYPHSLRFAKLGMMLRRSGIFQFLCFFLVTSIFSNVGLGEGTIHSLNTRTRARTLSWEELENVFRHGTVEKGTARKSWCEKDYLYLNWVEQRASIQPLWKVFFSQCEWRLSSHSTHLLPPIETSISTFFLSEHQKKYQRDIHMDMFWSVIVGHGERTCFPTLSGTERGSSLTHRQQVCCGSMTG